MDLRQLTPTLAVAPQILPEEIPQLAEAGFKVLINNRPDEEVGADINHDIMEKAAKEVGMSYHFLPFYPGQITPELISQFAEASAGQAPVIAYCRSGNRCTVLWALTQATKRPESEILGIAEKAGYDLTQIRPLIASLANRKG